MPFERESYHLSDSKEVSLNVGAKRSKDDKPLANLIVVMGLRVVVREMSVYEISSNHLNVWAR